VKTYVQLADYGALLNLLPICLAEFRTNEDVSIVTTAPYADLLEGVSYVQCQVADCQPYEIDKGMEWARNHCKGKIICTQVNGPKDLVRKFTYEPAGQQNALTTSWQKEMWKVSDWLHQWDECISLDFDCRNPAREMRLFRDVFPSKHSKKPIMLLALNGKSSPFPYGALLRYLLQTTFGNDWRIVDLPQDANHLYDLLGLYEKASLLVAVDSAPLHLAWAVRSLPVIALTNDKPLLWNGSSWRPNMVWYCRYGDWLNRWEEMLDVIRSGSIEVRGARQMKAGQFHVWSEYEVQRKHPSAFWIDLPISIGACGRDSAAILKDPKRVPYLRDCLRMAIQSTSPGQRIFLTRPDVEFDHITVPEGVAAFAYRMQAGSFAPVCDVFTAPREWWQAVLPELPDLLFGSDYWWSQCLWAIFRNRGAVDITGTCCRKAPEKAKRIPYVQPPRVTHNFNLWTKYAAEKNVTSRFEAVTSQIEILPLDTAGLFPGAYNPTIIDREGSIFMAYRYHGDTPATKLATARIRPDGSIEGNSKLEAVGHSLEDPKLFNVGSELWMSWVEAYFPVKIQGSVRYGFFREAQLNEVERPAYGQNDGDHIEKSWVFFQYQGEVFFIYKSDPKQVIVRWSGKMAGEYVTDGPGWAYGHIKGGTSPIEYDGKLLRFFHSTLDNEFAFPHKTAAHRRYFLGACLMEPEPPFRIVAVSRKPIAYGSESGGLTPPPFHFKPRVVFPGGAIARDWGWIVSVGINDCQCALLKITPKDLHL
jgi:hypothetical protein